MAFSSRDVARNAAPRASSNFFRNVSSVSSAAANSMPGTTFKRGVSVTSSAKRARRSRSGACTREVPLRKMTSSTMMLRSTTAFSCCFSGWVDFSGSAPSAISGDEFSPTSSCASPLAFSAASSAPTAAFLGNRKSITSRMQSPAMLPTSTAAASSRKSARGTAPMPTAAPTADGTKTASTRPPLMWTCARSPWTSHSTWTAWAASDLNRSTAACLSRNCSGRMKAIGTPHSGGQAAINASASLPSKSDATRRMSGPPPWEYARHTASSKATRAAALLSRLGDMACARPRRATCQGNAGRP
mmetsp:Transcript_9697/g.28089  ORF Transcript_9697/g.28089 Transcript_9697/m.28089 type:complete len:301 (+) Transcript_9697:1142-2044(+)